MAHMKVVAILGTLYLFVMAIVTNYVLIWICFGLVYSVGIITHNDGLWIVTYIVKLITGRGDE